MPEKEFNISDFEVDLQENLFRLPVSDKIRKIILYGSYARKDFHPESDIDILILMDIGQDDIRKYYESIDMISSTLSLKYNRFFSLIIKSHSHFSKYSKFLPFYENIINDGIEIYTG